MRMNSIVLVLQNHEKGEISEAISEEIPAKKADMSQGRVQKKPQSFPGEPGSWNTS